MSSGAPYGDPETRRAILEATRVALEERGGAFTLTDVAAHAGVTRQAIYLHFGDRAGLLLGLVRDMDAQLDLTASLAHVGAATSGHEVIARTMRLHESFSRSIDPVARVLEAGPYADQELGRAWRDRMRFRHAAHVRIVGRIKDLGDLADAWTVDTAADLLYAVTLPHVWREATAELGWTADAYIEHFTTSLGRALLVSRPGNRGTDT